MDKWENAPKSEKMAYREDRFFRKGEGKARVRKARALRKARKARSK